MYENLLRTLSTQTQAAVSKAVSTSITADKAGVTALDCLIADGFDQPTDFVSYKSKGSTLKAEEFAALNKAIMLGFTKANQALLAKPIKGLTDAQKTSRRYWQQQIGARRNDFKRQLTKRLDSDKPSDGAGSRNRPLDQRVRDNLNDVIKVCRAAEEPTFDVTEMVAKVKEALAVLK